VQEWVHVYVFIFTLLVDFSVEVHLSGGALQATMGERPLDTVFLLLDPSLYIRSLGGALQAKFFVIQPFLIHTYAH